LITSKFLALELPFHGQKSPEITARFELNSVFGLDSGTTTEHLPYSPDLAPCHFWAFPTMKRKLQGKKFQSDRGLQHVSRNRWGIVRSATVAKGGASRKRLSPHLHKIPSQSNKVSPQALQMALIYGQPPYGIDGQLNGMKGLLFNNVFTNSKYQMTRIVYIELVNKWGKNDYTN
jgi:hypothetical protein